jgi:hypothetical protein
MVWVAVGTWTASPAALWALMPVAALGALLPWHPFDYLYNDGIRRLTRTPPLPPHGRPRRFACLVATVWIGAIAWSFSSGAMAAGYALGWLMVLAAASPTMLGFCIPSWIYGRCAGAPACRM